MKYKILMLLALFFIATHPTMNAKEKADATIRILSIGNSFSDDAVEDHLYDIAKAAGKTLIIGNMYIGGCSLERHVANANGNKPAYRYSKRTADGVKKHTKDVALETALADEAWDIVTFQQQSGRSGIYETWEAHLPELFAYVKARIPEDATFMIHQTWAYDQTSTHKDFNRYGNDQMKMYEAIVDAVFKASELTGIKTIIPSGTAVQNARTTPLVNTITRDGYHMHKPVGRYIVACTWFEKIFGKKVIGNSYIPKGMTAEQVAYAQKAAHAAVKKPGKVTKIK
jgi:hypothetical protein